MFIIRGDIRTQQTLGAQAEVIVVDQDRVVYVGTHDAAKAKYGDDLETLDYGSNVVLPGLIDSHIHFLSYGLMRLKQVDLTAISTQTGLVDSLLCHATNTTGWIEGRGFDQERFDNNAWPTRRDLDKVSDSRPVIITRICGHAVVVNSVAIGMLSSTEQEKGNASTGLFTETAIAAIKNCIPSPNETNLEDAVLAAADVALRQGITAVGTLLDTPAQFGAYIRLEQQTKLPVRMTGMPSWSSIDSLMMHGIRTGFGSNWTKVGGAKLFADGSLGARTARLSSPYEDAPGALGDRIFTPHELGRRAKIAAAAGFQIVIHAIGDQAVREALDAIIGTMTKGDGNPLRHRLEHVSLASPDIINDMADYGIIAAIQPQFVTSDPWTIDRVGPTRAKQAYPFQSLVNANIPIALGSDCPVEQLSSAATIIAATRRAPWSPDEKLSLDQTLYAYTHGSAYSIFRDDIIGSLSPGKFADFIVYNATYEGLEDQLEKGLLPAEVWVNGLRVR